MEPVAPLPPDQVLKQIKDDETESTPHRVIEMLDATVRSVYGPQDETISAGDARDVLTATGIKKDAAIVLDHILNLFSADHGEKALIADYVRAVLEQKRIAPLLDPQTLEIITKALS